MQNLLKIVQKTFIICIFFTITYKLNLRIFTYKLTNKMIEKSDIQKVRQYLKENNNTAIKLLLIDYTPYYNAQLLIELDVIERNKLINILYPN